MYGLPNLVFTSDGELCSENNFLSQLPENTGTPDIHQRLHHSMKNGDYHSFRRFCLREFSLDNDSANYAVYSLIGRNWIPFRFMFCEKNNLGGQPVTVVYFGKKLSEFYPMMSPASPICRDTTGRLIHDIFRLTHLRQSNLITPEALFSFGEFPLLCNLSGEQLIHPERMCDILRLTQMTFQELSEKKPFENTEFQAELLFNERISRRPRTQPIVHCPVEAYIYLITILSCLFNSLSEDLRIRAEIGYFAQGVSAEFSTYCPSLSPKLTGTSNPEDYFAVSDPMHSLAKVASAIALTFNIHMDFHYVSDTHMLKSCLGVGYETYLPVEFRYSDPYSLVPSVLAEVLSVIPA